MREGNIVTNRYLYLVGQTLGLTEDSVCLARGRSYVLPVSPLIETCDQWHVSDLADIWDGSIVSVAVLRRDLVGFIAVQAFTPKLTYLSRRQT